MRTVEVTVDGTDAATLTAAAHSALTAFCGPDYDYTITRMRSYPDVVLRSAGEAEGRVTTWKAEVVADVLTRPAPGDEEPF